MFRSARLKLTAWYLLIIMLVSLSFSAAIYRVLSVELERVERLQKLRVERRLPESPPLEFMPMMDRGEWRRPFFLDPDLMVEAKKRLLLILTLVNLSIFGAAALAGYFLAGRTLRPIAEMVEEQKRFVTNASHELRTPLTSLKAEIEVNLRDRNLDLAGARQLLTSNLEEVNKLRVLADELIKLAQYQKSEKNGWRVENVSLAAVSAEAVRKVVGLAKSKDIRLVNKMSSGLVVGDRQALTELLVIFLDNAVKYSPAKTTVTLSAAKKGDQVFVRVTDQGLGISQADWPHLFDRFYRADKSRAKGAAPGYGLGLAIAKQIVEKHHGSLKVQSQPRQGTTFTVGLPATPVGQT
jgi:signal transduction histidine kinase